MTKIAVSEGRGTKSCSLDIKEVQALHSELQRVREELVKAIEKRDSVFADLQHLQAALQTASLQKDAVIEQQQAHMIDLENELQQLREEQEKDDAEQPARKKAKTQATDRGERKRDIAMGQANYLSLIHI